MILLNSKLNIERNHEFYVDKFKIILELMRGDILSANCILNKISHKKLEKTLYELWNGQRPSYKYMKVVGFLETITALPLKKVKIWTILYEISNYT
jgi:hypothetical protein